jgi:hypothetical protein
LVPRKEGQPEIPRGGYRDAAPQLERKEENYMAKMVGTKRRGKTRIKGSGHEKTGKGKKF